MIKDNYNKYQKEYREKKLVMLSVQLNKEKDKDIIEAIGTENKNEKAKRLIRMGMYVK